MKKKRKRSKNKTKKKFFKKVKSKKKSLKSRKKKKRRNASREKTKKKKDFYSKGKNQLLIKIIDLQEKLRPNIKIKFNPFVSLDNFLQKFFQNISDTIGEYKSLKKEKRMLSKIEELERIENEKIEKEKKILEQKELKSKLNEQILRDEIKLEKERAKDIKLFLRKEQALLRQEQAEKQRKFLAQLKIERQIEKFRIREIKELEQLEKISLKEKREDYASLQERIDKLKQKYQEIRDQKIRERVEALGIKTLGDEDRETFCKKSEIILLHDKKLSLRLKVFIEVQVV